MAKRKENDYGTGIPRQDVEIFARVLWPSIKAYLESEQGQQEFADWKMQQEKQKRNKTA